FNQLPAWAQTAFNLLDPAQNTIYGKPMELAAHGIGSVAKGAASDIGLTNLAEKAGTRLESPQQRANRLEIAADQLQPALEDYAHTTGQDYHEVESQFSTDPQFRQQLGYTGKLAQIGNDLAQSIRENTAESYRKTYDLTPEGQAV